MVLLKIIINEKKKLRFLLLTITITNLYFGLGEDPLIPAYSSTNYVGKSASTDFCRKTAFQYCKSSSMPEFCMQRTYIDPGYCMQAEGKPNRGCSQFSGIKKEHDFFCQTTACKFSFEDCMKKLNCVGTCWERIGSYMAKIYGSLCQEGATDATGLRSAPVRRLGEVIALEHQIKGNCPAQSATTAAPPLSNAECWASNGGWSGQCEICPEESVQQGQCTIWSWYPCQKSYKSCNAHKSDMTTCLSASCAKNLKEANIKKPVFKGPNCYDSKYGLRFNENWTPTKRTAFEKYFPDVTEFYKWILLEGSAKNPNLNDQWGGLTECQAAGAIYENVVCAIELLQEKNKAFEAAPDGSRGNISEFMNNGDEKINKLEIAAMFAHFQKETGRLVEFLEKQTVPYTIQSDIYPAVPGKSYLGRGPFQLSYNINYGRLSEHFFEDKNILLNDPDIVDPEGPMGIVASLWFWFTPLEWAHEFPITGKIRPRDAIVHWFDNRLTKIYQDPKYDDYAGFGLTINLINSDECTEGVSNYGNAPWRVYYFLAMANRLGLALDLEEPACLTNKECYGITKGCTGAHAKYVCEPQDLGCGIQYNQGATPFCELKPW